MLIELNVQIVPYKFEPIGETIYIYIFIDSSSIEKVFYALNAEQHISF